MFAVKKFEAEDWRTYKAMRLEGLSRHADVYGNSLKLESAWSDSQWEYMLGSPRNALFGLYDGTTLIGSSAVFTDRNDKKGRTALLAGSYIREEYRGRKLSRLLYAARIEWIVDCGRFDCITVGHKKGNEASRRANQAFGFTYAGEEEKDWGDGSRDILMKYEMRLAS
jgi:RimJ/RimL family protein N-acetyltransferase